MRDMVCVLAMILQDLVGRYVAQDRYFGTGLATYASMIPSFPRSWSQDEWSMIMIRSRRQPNVDSFQIRVISTSYIVGPDR